MKIIYGDRGGIERDFTLFILPDEIGLMSTVPPVGLIISDCTFDSCFIVSVSSSGYCSFNTGLGSVSNLGLIIGSSSPSSFGVSIIARML